MFVRIFTVKFHVATECFDDQEVQEFIKNKEVLSIREHFFVKHETPYIVLIVTYLPGASPPSQVRRNTKEAWRESISNEQLPLFNALREWRMARAKQDGVPPFVICTNKEFVEMVTQRPDSLAGLTKIYGFGKAKTEKYGKEILAVLATPPKSSQETTAQSPDQKEQALQEEQAPQEEQVSREGQPLPKKPDSQQGMFEKGSKQTTSTKGQKQQGQKQQGQKTT